MTGVTAICIYWDHNRLYYTGDLAAIWDKFYTSRVEEIGDLRGQLTEGDIQRIMGLQSAIEESCDAVTAGDADAVYAFHELVAEWKWAVMPLEELYRLHDAGDAAVPAWVVMIEEIVRGAVTTVGGRVMTRQDVLWLKGLTDEDGGDGGGQTGVYIAFSAEAHQRCRDLGRLVMGPREAMAMVDAARARRAAGDSAPLLSAQGASTVRQMALNFDGVVLAVKVDEGDEGGTDVAGNGGKKKQDMGATRTRRAK